MAKKATLGVIELGAGPAAVGDVRGYTYDSEANEIDTTIMNAAGNSRFQPGSIRHNLTVEYFFEDADAGQALVKTGVGSDTAIAVALYPRGKTTGEPQLTGNFFVMSNQVSGQAPDAIEGSFALVADENGATWATVP